MNQQEVIGVVALVLGAVICLNNWLTLYVSWKKKRVVSAVPLLGALLLAYGLASFPATQQFVWVSVIADYGTLILILALPKFINELWSTSRINLLRSLVSLNSDRTVELKLFKKTIFTIADTYDPPIPCNPHGARVVSRGYRGKWKQEGSAFVLKDYCEDRQLCLRQEGDHFVSVETNYPDDNESPYDSLTRLTFEELKA